MRLTGMRMRQSDGDVEPDEPDERCDWCDERVSEDEAVTDSEGWGRYHPACRAKKEDT